MAGCSPITVDKLPDGAKRHPSFPHYFASPVGEVLSCRGVSIKLLRADMCGPGKYLGVMVYDEGGRRHRKAVHRFVCEAFHGPAPTGCEASHLNGNKYDNRPSNLVWEDHRSNMHRRVGHDSYNRGARAGTAKFTDEQVVEIRKRFRLAKNRPRLAKEFGCSVRTLYAIARGDRYKDSENIVTGYDPICQEDPTCR